MSANREHAREDVMNAETQSTDTVPGKDLRTNPMDCGVSRRQLLLTGTTLAAASAFGVGAPIGTA